jgi:hypothetical protein
MLNEAGLLSPTYETSNADILVKSGYGRLRGILVTAAKEGDTNTLELMDNSSNANPVLVREFEVAAPKYYYFADVGFLTGLYIVVKGTLYFTVYYF